MGKVVEEVAKPVKKAVKSFAKAPFDMIRGIGRGDFGGIMDSAARIASGGTMGLSDKGLVNPASVAKTVGIKMSSGAPAVGGLTLVAKKKGQTQLRQGKGAGGGGSFTEVAKDSLGGASGSTGK